MDFCHGLWYNASAYYLKNGGKNMQGNETNFKKAVTIPYTQVPNDVLYDGKLSLKAKGLWAYMNAKPSGWFFLPIV